MKILLYSPAFAPSIGGLEAMMEMLAHEFTTAGHTVQVVTTTPSNRLDTFPFAVLRRPSPHALLQATAWCDVFLQGNISLKGLWPLAVHPRSFIASHHGVYQRTNGRLGWQDWLKRFVTRFSVNISVSEAVASKLPGRHEVIPNSYRDNVFMQVPDVRRDIEFVFLGRLVSDKGTDLLLTALANLKQIGLTPRLTIIGGGPEEMSLRRQAVELQLVDQVTFTGPKQGNELVELLNTHQIMVVPSRWQEPFGIVALEGIACGCVVVGSSGGGLPEAIGPCGETFPNGDVAALTAVLARLLQSPEQLESYRSHAPAHLAKHRPADVAARYLAVMQDAVRKAQK